MARSYAALPYEYFEEMADLSDEEFGRLARALLVYSMTGEESALAGNERFFWRRVVNRERGLQQHYEEVAARRSEQGRAAAAKRWGRDADGMPEHTEDAKDKDKVKVKAKDKDKDKVDSPPSKDGRSPAAGRAATERQRRDMEELLRLEREGKL